jgi:hypothetical protein
MRQTVKDLRQSRRLEAASDLFSAGPQRETGLSDFFGASSQRASFLDETLRKREALENFKRSIEGKLPLERSISPQTFGAPMLSVSPVANPLDSPSGSPAGPALPASPALRLPDLQGGGFDSRFGSPLSSFPGLNDGQFTASSSYLPAAPRFQPPQQASPPPPMPGFIFPKRPFQ